MEHFSINKGTDQLEDLLFTMQQRNLVYNGDFRYFSNQMPNGAEIEYGVPDGWIHMDSGQNGKIGFDPSTNECVITKSSDNSLMTFKQNSHEFRNPEKNTKVKVSVLPRRNARNEVR